jgi:hypothetical protein
MIRKVLTTAALTLAMSVFGCSDVAPTDGVPTKAPARGDDTAEREDDEVDDLEQVGDGAPSVRSRIDASVGDGGTGPVADGAAERDDGAAIEDGDDTASSARPLPPVQDLDAAGPFEVVIEQNAGPNKGWIARPKNLGDNGIKHPVFSWGCGGGSQPSQYKDHLNRIASHGFVVEAHVSTGNVADHKVVLDWVTSENDRQGSVYYQKLDPTKIAAGGHSMGSIATFAIAGDPRLTTTIHVAGGSFDGNGFKSWKKPTAIIAGANDQLATGNATRDWERATVPVWFTLMTGVDHIQAARQGLGPIVGWLRWHLAGETERKADFIGASCTFCSGKYKTQSKNWD